MKWDKNKKKATKKPINLHLKKNCSLCIYAVQVEYDQDTFNCHRYPQTMKAANTHWCGEYIHRDKS
jgi:hypothetical protein